MHRMFNVCNLFNSLQIKITRSLLFNKLFVQIINIIDE